MFINPKNSFQKIDSEKPLISESNTPDEVYLGRVIIEFWGKEGQEVQQVSDPFPNQPAFVWRVDNPSTNDLSKPDRLKLFLAGLEGAVRHIKDVAQYSKKL